MVLFFLPHPEWHGDLIIYRDAAQFATLPYPYYFRFFALLLTWLPETVAYGLISLLTIGFFLLAWKVFGGRHWFIFLSYSLAWVLFYGQVDGLVIGGLALTWWAVERKRAYLVGVGMVLAALKPQLAGFLLLAMWWWAPSRWKALVVPALVTAASFAVWGFWVPEWVGRLSQARDLMDLPRNISLWGLTGYWIWLVWPLVYALPLDRRRKLIAIAAATAMTVPYFPLPSSLLLLAQPIPVLFYALLQLPVLAGFVGAVVYDIVRIVPPLLLLWAAWPAWAHMRARWGQPNPAS